MKNQYLFTIIFIIITAALLMVHNQNKETKITINDDEYVVLPLSAKSDLSITISNNDNDSLRIYPAAGDDLGNGINTYTVLAPGKTIKFNPGSGNTWKTKCPKIISKNTYQKEATP